MTIKITICREGWRLYDLWQDALDDRPIETDEVIAAHNAFQEHRKTCPECTPHGENSTQTS